MAESHTVARTYLKGFAAKVGRGILGLVVYNKHQPLAEQVSAQAIESAEHISTRVDYYGITLIDGASVPLLEDGLRSVEDHWPDLARSLRRPGVGLSRGQLGSLAAIAGIWEARSRRTIDALEIQFTQQIAQERGKLAAAGVAGDALEAALAASVRKRFAPEFADRVAPTAENLARAALRDMAESNYAMLRRMNIAVLTIPSPAEGRAVGFFTSDHPVAWIDPVRGGHGALLCPNKLGRNVEVTFPLSKAKCLLFSFQPIAPLAEVDEKTVDIINARSMLCGLDEVYAPPASTNADRFRHLLSLKTNRMRDPFTPIASLFFDAGIAPVDNRTVARELGLPPEIVEVVAAHS